METTDKRYRRAFQMAALALLFLLYGAVPLVARLATGTSPDSVDVGMQIIRRPLGLLFWAFLCYLWWRMLGVLAKRTAASRVRWSVLALLPVLLIGGQAAYRSLPAVRARWILANIELAPLPKSATAIKVYTWSSPFSGEQFLRFRGSRADIEEFVEASPILKDAECRRYSKDRMRLIDSDGYARNDGPDSNDHEYARARGGFPPWFMQEIRGPARRYTFVVKRIGHGAEVIVDEEKNLVFVRLSLG